MPFIQRVLKPISSKRAQTFAIHGATASMLFFIQSGQAFAAGDIFQPIESVFDLGLQFLTGSFATTAATIACAAVGYLALTSRIPWSWCFSIMVGVAFIFGGAQLVETMQSGMGQ